MFTFTVQVSILVLFVVVHNVIVWHGTIWVQPCLSQEYVWNRDRKPVLFCETNSLHSGFKGLLCEENINDCVPEPCHHGECKDGIATFSCECYAGYTGSICNIQVQECHSNPCQNRGRCIDLVNAYQCNCPPGITGRFSVKLFSCWSCFPAIISSVRPWD